MSSNDNDKERVLKTVKDNNVRFIRLWFTDILGFLKSDFMPPPRSGFTINMLYYLGFFFGGSDDDDGSPIGGLLMIILAPIAAMLIQMAISRSREYGADRGGAEICGKPLALASALLNLERGVEAIPMKASPASAHMFIVNPLRGGGMKSLFSTHPPTEERVRRLREMA